MNTYWILCNVPHSSYFVFPHHATYMLNLKSQVSKQTSARDHSLYFACLFLLGHLPALYSVLSCLALQHYSILGNLQIKQITVTTNVFKCLKRVGNVLSRSE